jgi:hypothetical protein
MYSLIFAPPAHAITFVKRGEVCLFRDKVAAEARDDASCAEGGYLSGGVPL